MHVSIIMYIREQVSSYLLSIFAAGHGNNTRRRARADPGETFRDDVIALTYAASLALHDLRLLMASMPRSDGPVRAILRPETQRAPRRQR